MRFPKRLLLTLVMMAVAANAFALGKGSSLLGITVGGGEADYVTPSGTLGYVTSQPKLSEVRLGLEYWHAMSSDMAFTISGGIGHFGENDKPGTAALPGAEDQKSTITSFHARIGSDHYSMLGDKITIYFGGGLVYWNGALKYEAGSTSTTYPTVSRYGIDGRMGAFYSMGNVQMGGRLSRAFAWAMADDNGAKASWTTGDVAGEAVISFGFGAAK